MRESRKGEKSHLPKDSTEIWLGAQKTAARESKHRTPPEDTYGLWIEKRVESARGSGAKGRKTVTELTA